VHTCPLSAAIGCHGRLTLEHLQQNWQSAHVEYKFLAIILIASSTGKMYTWPAKR
jgi:hypothetical protein